MSIPHRIFVSKHKHKKKFTRRKVVYKKFLGLKTFKNVFYTVFPLSLVQPSPVKKLVRRRVIKKPVRKRPLRLNFSNLKLLRSHARRHEVILAHADIANFKNLKAESLKVQAPREKFQAFLSQEVWDRMTPAQKGAHIKKRTELAMQRQRRLVQPTKYFFVNKGSRPAINQMTFAYRRQYLKNLIKFANTSTPSLEVKPFDAQLAINLPTIRVKAILQANKKIRAKRSAYKNLTYASLVPGIAAKLTF